MPPKNGNADLVLYYHPFSFHSQKVAMSLYQKGLKFRPVYVDVSRGRQANTKLLSLNPTGEVPVLVDDVRIIPDSEHIINYLEDNFANGTPRLRPSDHDLRSRVEHLNDLIHALKVDALTFGSIMFDDLDLTPKAPFDDPAYRHQLKVIGESRTATLLAEMIQRPKNAFMLEKRVDEMTEEDVWWQDSEKYLDLILQFERVMDECEAEFQTHEDNRWWLGSPEISIADVSFSILLHRLWQLGFERRMWGERPFIKRYYSRVQQLDSFKLATNMSGGNGLSDFIGSPYLWGFLGAVALAGGGFYLWNKHQTSGQEMIPTVLTSKGISSSYGGPDRLKLSGFTPTNQ